MANELIKLDYSIETYKPELEQFYKKIKNLFIEITKLNTQKELFKDLVPSVINNEADLKQNKACIDSINTLFKPLEIINNDIKKTLNNWKSNFAGKNGLDNLIDNLKQELIQPFKQEQLKYDQLISETKTLKEQAEIKTTIGIRTYKVVVFDEIIPTDVPMRYWSLNETLVREDIKKNPNIEIRGIKYHIEEVKK